MKKHNIGLQIEENAYQDSGNGVISFPSGLTITDDSVQRNGTRYDIETLDVEEYKGTLTADHNDTLNSVIGKVEGLKKQGNKVTVDSIKFAVKENALAKLAYDLFKGGYLTDFSTETYGPQPDDNGIYFNSRLIGLSAVVTGNNKNAKVTELVTNSLKQSYKQGLDISYLENEFHEEISQIETINKKEEVKMDYVTVENTRDFDVTVTYTNAAGKEVTSVLNAASSLDVAAEQKELVENQIEKAVAPKAPVAEVVEEKQENDFAAALEAALAPMKEKLEKMEQNAFDIKAEEPKFEKEEKTMNSAVQSLDWKDRHAKQINAAWEWKKNGRAEAANILNEINEINLSELKKDGIVSNSMTIADFGNFVISRELLTQIEGCRNDYTALISAVEFKETLSTQFAWLKRSGDINMTSVEFCDDDANGNLKPISEYSATIETSDLEELAAVTPVCNAATRFLAADLLADVAQGYRNDYDRKRAQLVVARLEQAVEANGNSVIYDVNPAIGGLTAWVDTWAQIATCTPNGTYVFNTSTYAEIMKQAVTNGVSGPLGSIFITGDVPTIFGRPFIVVPDDLMPTLNTAQTKSFAVDGGTVTVNHAVFYANLANFTGRTSGGLMYDLSTEAAYEDGGTVKSAYQRNELVLRGSFFRGGAIKDEDQVAGLLSPGVS
jgi:hypothetical protein